MHGIERSADGKAVALHHGFLQLVQNLTSLALEPGKPALRRFRTKNYVHATHHFRDCVWKFDRAAGHVERGRTALEVGNAPDLKGVSLEDPRVGAYFEALYDLPLYLDSMLFYQRIQADAYAYLLPFLYERHGIIPPHSFREQCNWFKTARPSFDKEYSAILEARLEWFDALSGKTPSGLREVLVHGGGIQQLAWPTPEGNGTLELLAGLIGRSGYVEEDLIGALRRIHAGWCEFLDDVFTLFAGRLASPDAPADVLKQSVYQSSNGRDLPSFWVYPRAAP